MKMQNVEMEFVAFDVQDVIATSGGVTFINGSFLLQQGNDDSKFSDAVGDGGYVQLMPDATRNNSMVYLELSGISGFSWYSFDSVYDFKHNENQYINDDGYTVSVTGYAAKPTGTQITDLAGILDWLHSNTNYNSQ